MKNADALKAITVKNLRELSAQMNRGEQAIVNSFGYRLLPILLGNLYSSSNVAWENEFFKYIIENKVKSIGDVSWTSVLQRWPHQTRFTITNKLDKAMQGGQTKGLLFEQVSAFMDKISVKPMTKLKKVVEHQEKIIQIHDALMKVKSLNSSISQ